MRVVVAVGFHAVAGHLRVSYTALKAYIEGEEL